MHGLLHRRHALWIRLSLHGVLIRHRLTHGLLLVGHRLALHLIALRLCVHVLGVSLLLHGLLVPWREGGRWSIWHLVDGLATFIRLGHFLRDSHRFYLGFNV